MKTIDLTGNGTGRMMDQIVTVCNNSNFKNSHANLIWSTNEIDNDNKVVSHVTTSIQQFFNHEEGKGEEHAKIFLENTQQLIHGLFEIME